MAAPPRRPRPQRQETSPCRPRTSASPVRHPCPTRSARRVAADGQPPRSGVQGAPRPGPRPADAVRTTNEVLITGRPGTGGLEAAVVNFLSPGDRCSPSASACSAIGSRAIATTYGADVIKPAFEWGRAADPDLVRDELRAMAGGGPLARGRAADLQRDLDRGHQPPRGARRGRARGGARRARSSWTASAASARCPSTRTPGASTSSSPARRSPG